MKMTNKLSEEYIDQQLADPRKPFRRVMDDKVIPAVGAVAGGAAATVGALANLQTVNRLKPVTY